MLPWHLELVLSCLRTKLVFKWRKHERRVLWKLQRGLAAVKSWCERCNIEINEEKAQPIYFSRRLKSSWGRAYLIGRDVPLVNNVTYLGVTFDRRMTWRHHIEMTVAKAVRTYLKTYSLFKSGRLITNIKPTLYNTFIRSVMTYACPTWEYQADAQALK
jgi:hypothetical protein